MTISIRLDNELSEIAVISDVGDFLFEELFLSVSSYRNLLRQISDLTRNLSAEHKSQTRLGLRITDLTFSSGGVVTSGEFPFVSSMPLFRDL